MKKTLLSPKRRSVLFYESWFTRNFTNRFQSLPRKAFFHLPTTHVTKSEGCHHQHVELVEGTRLRINYRNSWQPIGTNIADIDQIEKFLLWAKSKYCVGVRQVIVERGNSERMFIPDEGKKFYKIILEIPEVKTVFERIVMMDENIVNSVLGTLETCTVYTRLPNIYSKMFIGLGINKGDIVEVSSEPEESKFRLLNHKCLSAVFRFSQRPITHGRIYGFDQPSLVIPGHITIRNRKDRKIGEIEHPKPISK